MNSTKKILYVSLVNDLPRAFIYRGSKHLAGPYAETLKYFAYYENFEFHFDVFQDVGMYKQISADINQGFYNISTYSVAFTENPPNSQSYPMEYMEKCVMVPLEDEINKLFYIIWPYDTYIWLTIFFGAIYIAILMRYVEEASATQKFARSIIRNIPHAINISLYTNNMGINLRNASMRVLIFYFLLYIYGFILAAYHSPYMTAYNMKPIFREPINTVQDILDSKLHIKIKNTDLRDMQANDDINLTVFEDILDNITGIEFQQLLLDFNRSYAYIVSIDQWDFVRKQQQILKQKKFHLSKVCLNAALRAFPMEKNWPFLDEFNDFILRVQEAGLWQHFVELSFLKAVLSKNITILQDTYPVEPLNLEFFTIAWSVLCTGSIISFFIIILENVIWFKQKRQFAVIVV